MMMKRRYLLLPAVALALVAVGCATTGYTRANKAASSMTATSQELVAGRQQVTRAMNALNTLVAASEGDLRPRLKAFQTELAALRSAANNARMRADMMRGQMEAYFVGWGDEIQTLQNPDIKQQSLKRRGEAMLSYREIEKAAQDTAAAYRPLIVDLEDIQSYLGQDLTAKGLAGVRGFTGKATADAADLQQKIDSVVKELDRASREIDSRSETGG